MTPQPLPDITDQLRQRKKTPKSSAVNAPAVEAPPDFAKALISAPNLQTLQIEERPKLLGEWMREGDLGYLFAPRGHGKTWLAMLTANAIAEGKPLGEWSGAGEGRSVIYFDAEMNLPDLRERFQQIGASSDNFRLLSNELLFLHGLPSVNIACPQHQAALSALLPEGAFFVIDNLSTSQSGMKENDNDAFDALREWFLSLRHRRITLLIIHHAGRNGDMRGGSRREDMAHWILSLRDASKDGSGEKAFSTTFTKCRNCRANAAPPLKWTLADQGGSIALSCSVHQGPEVLLGHIEDGVTRATELAELIGVKAGTISKWAGKLMDAGRIEKAGRDYKIKTLPYSSD